MSASSEDVRLEVRIEPDPEGDGFVARAPAIGRWCDPPADAALVTAGSRVGSLTRLNARLALVIPQGVAGAVHGPLPRDRETPVEFGQILFRIAPLSQKAGQPAARAAGPASAHGEALPEGTWAVVSPTDGTFYRSPKPGTPPFVEAGSSISTGQPLGLVEVMKTFNRVLYGGVGLPERAQVVEVRCGDTAEVHAGQILFLVR